MRNFFIKNKILILSISLCVFLLIIFNVDIVLADEISSGRQFFNAGSNLLGTAVALVLGLIALLLNSIFGLITTMFISLVMSVAQYNDIITAPTVKEGWVIVRDLCNMFFILILLVIAFSTILNIESYNAKRTLPKLLLMAVLINFSKTIFGLIIDFSQVIMLTFVNGFKASGAFNFISILNISDILSINQTGGWTNSALTSWATAVAVIAGVIASMATMITVGVLLCVLIARIIMLWIYTILSPLVFMGFAFPPLQKHTGQIWESFIKQVIVGPVLAFFIWLALSTVETSSIELYKHVNSEENQEVCAGASAFFCAPKFQQYVIAIGLLIGGLMVAQQMGGAASSIAGKGLDWVKKGAATPWKGLAAAGKLTGKGALEGLSYLNDRFLHKPGYGDLNLKRVASKWKTKLDENKAKRYDEGISETQKRIKEGKAGWFAQLTGTPEHTIDQIMKDGWGNLNLANEQTGLRQLFRAKKNKAMRDQLEPEIEEQKFRLQAAKMNDGQKHDEDQKLAKEELAKRKEIRDLKKSKAGKTKKEQKAIDEQIAQKEREEDMLLKKRKVIAEYQSKSPTKKETKKLQENFEAKKAEYDKYAVPTNLEARRSEQKLTQEAKASLGDITDSEELSNMLRQAMKTKDKALIKAISMKLTENGDENDALLNNLGYDMSLSGLHSYIRDLQTNQGFTEEEAMNLGSEISNRAKAVNHWNLAGAYKRDFAGNIQEASAQEQYSYSLNEIGKKGGRYILSSIGRFGFGDESKDGDFTPNALGMALVKMLDNEALRKSIASGYGQETFYKNMKTTIEKMANQNLLDGREMVKAINTASSLDSDYDYDEAYQDIQSL